MHPGCLSTAPIQCYGGERETGEETRDAELGLELHGFLGWVSVLDQQADALAGFTQCDVGSARVEAA